MYTSELFGRRHVLRHNPPEFGGNGARNRRPDHRDKNRRDNRDERTRRSTPAMPTSQHGVSLPREKPNRHVRRAGAEPAASMLRSRSRPERRSRSGPGQAATSRRFPPERPVGPGWAYSRGALRHRSSRCLSYPGPCRRHGSCFACYPYSKMDSPPKTLPRKSTSSSGPSRSTSRGCRRRSTCGPQVPCGPACSLPARRWL